MSRWLIIAAERALYVHCGRDVILCDDHQPGARTIVLKLNNAQIEKLAVDLFSTERDKP